MRKEGIGGPPVRLQENSRERWHVVPNGGGSGDGRSIVSGTQQVLGAAPSGKFGGVTGSSLNVLEEG